MSQFPSKPESYEHTDPSRISLLNIRKMSNSADPASLWCIWGQIYSQITPSRKNSSRKNKEYQSHTRVRIQGTTERALRCTTILDKKDIVFGFATHAATFLC